MATLRVMRLENKDMDLQPAPGEGCADEDEDPSGDDTDLGEDAP